MEYSHVEIARSLRREEPVISNLELLPLDIFVRKGLNYPYARQIIFDLSIYLGDLYPVLPECSSHPLIEDISEREHERQHDKGGDGKIAADTRKYHESTRDLYKRYDDILGTVMQELGDLKKIARDPAHELTYLLIVEEGKRQLLIVREYLRTHVVFHLRAHHVTYI